MESAEAVERQVRFGVARLAPAPYHRSGRLLTVDGALQSYVDLADPTYLHLPYATWAARVLDLHWPAGQPVSAIQVGGGGFTIARYLAATRPGSPQVVYELDGPLVDLVRSHLALDAIADLHVRVEDGGAGVERTPDATADVVVMDVFQGGTVTVHLAAVEFLREIARVLRPGGLYLGNMWSTPDMTLPLRAAASLTAVFPHVVLLAQPGLLLGRQAGNVVLAASGRELPHRALTTWARSAGNRVFCLSGAQLTAVRGSAPPLTAAHPAAAPTVPDWTR
ncbi:fused MFS/spermidine synthase [Actinosynnema sp. NPDC047251]|uniref:Spermidine synthase-like protein n=1 Tax=Saccharothrix espanaensis (strain ATCC 51144 / DSM 44229 / JCM 9112 / NBRC 15066 / NRRL 15764) TaxID=1179773 RepID=K0JT22_SACES|nr:fused MFS/spermidine synthase [Saccharothrix espanaensis]CCH30915.1 Spermidine synthase-like protein [Saccharothrix espanaensis DSM 44229]